MREYKTKYNIGDVIGDFVIRERDYETGGRGTRFHCECLKCGRMKSMLTSTLTSEVGITHKSCS